MTYAEAVAWLDEFANLERRPDPHRWSGIKLERVHLLLEALGNPHRRLKVVHIAGSKGKGSTAALVDSMLRAAGYRTGLYTSPHLVSPRERIRVDGRPIAREEVARLVAERIRPAAEARIAAGDDDLSWFDLHTALGLTHFAEAGVDWAVIEVGMGGRLDATNVVSPTVCAITPISLEHTQFLGTTLEAIAAEKAGIIKVGVPVVLGEQPPEAERRIRRVAAEVEAPVHAAAGVEAVLAPFVDLGDRVGQRLLVVYHGEAAEAFLPLLGDHQRGNAATALTVAELLRDRGARRLTRSAVLEGFAAVHWPGRLQVLGRRPWLLLDGAHNPASARVLTAALELFPHRRRYGVLGSARDKDLAGIIAELGGGFAGLIACGVPDNPRSLPADDLRPLLERHAPRVAAAADVQQAVGLAQDWAEADDLIVVCGSLYLVGDALRRFVADAPA